MCVACLCVFVSIFFNISGVTADLITRKHRLIWQMIKSEEKTWECTNGVFLSSAAALSKQSVSGLRTELSKSSDSAVKSRKQPNVITSVATALFSRPILSMDPQWPLIEVDENKIPPCCFISGREPSAQTSSYSGFWPE